MRAKRNVQYIQKHIKGQKSSVLNSELPKPFLGDTSACTQVQDINNHQFLSADHAFSSPHDNIRSINQNPAATEWWAHHSLLLPTPSWIFWPEIPKTDLACWSRKKSCRLDIVTIWDFGIWAIITASVFEAGVF